MNVKTEQLAEMLGSGNVLDDPSLLESYSKDQSFVMPIKPWGIVKPRNLEDVQQIIGWANKSHTSLVPVSSGSPHFRGDTVPGTPGAIMVDMQEMKRIIRINRRNRMAMIEPGVTYSQLQPELAKEGLTLPNPLLPRTNKSVIASLLEREPRLIPRLQWSILDPLRCIQVVWGDGVKMTTGDAESNGTLEEEWQKGYTQLIPSGPQQTDFYKLVSAAQGTMGIVTWASIRCEVLPDIHKLFFAPSPKLENLIDPLYRILRFRFGDELFILNKWSLASILGDGPDQIKSLAEKLSSWVILIGIAGRYVLTKEKVDYLQKDISDIVQQFGLQLQPSIPGTDGDEVLNKILYPSREPYWRLGYKGGCQDIFFLSTLEKSPEFVKTMYAIAEQLDYPTSEIGIYIQPIHQGASCHIDFALPYNPNNYWEVYRMKELYIKASEALLKQGAYFSRPYGKWAEMAFNRDVQTTTVLRKIKNIFDPNNIMNTGKLCF